MALIELRDIYKHYPKRSKPVLDGVSLTIPKNSRLAMIGPSGSGKTTLLQIIGMLLSPDQGQLMVNGEDATKWSEKKKSRWRNRQIGFIFQDYRLIPELTVLDNVLLPGLIQGVRASKLPARSLLAKVGLRGLEKAFPQELSGGEEQRVAIARALINNPGLVLADEPTGNLDSNSGNQVVQVLTELQQEYGNTLLVVTHNQELAQKISDEKLWLVDGKMHKVEDGEEHK